MALTDTWLRAAKGAEKPYKKSDAGGLYILVNPDGKRYWRLAYRFGGKQKTLALGTYPLIGLGAAREARDSAKRALLQGRDPSEVRKAERAAMGADNQFEAVAREWHEWKKSTLSERYAGQVMDRLEINVFPEIGHLPIDKIEPPTLLAMLKKIEARGAITMAKRIKEHCSQIFRYAIVLPEAKAKRDPCADLRGALKPNPPVKHHTVVRFNDLPQLLRDIDNYAAIGQEITQLALKLASLTLLRTTELRGGMWSEISDLDAKEPLWSVPDERMKMEGRDGHLVPLSRQAVATLRELRKVTEYGKLMFPGEKPGACMSNNTMLFALYRMGYRSRQTTHGFRRIASTILNEAGFRSEAIEKQLAHEEKNAVRRAYNAAEYLPERRQMMQWYADYLDALKTGEPGKVVTFRRVA